MLYFLSKKDIVPEREKMKKHVKLFVVSLLCIALTAGSLIPAFAMTGFEEKINSYCSNINAITVYDMTADKMLFAKNENKHISIASTTKLLTCLVALSVFQPDDVITVGQEIYLRKPNSSVCLIQPGHKLKIRTLIAALLLPSGNDAAYTVAVNTARKHSGQPDMSYERAVSYFANLMNEEAKKLGCENTYFVNPEGWDNPNHYSTASDMTKIACAALNNAIIASIANIHYSRFYFYSGEWIDWYNTNKLLDPESKYYYPYAHGLKTGTTNAAGKCLIAFAEKDGRKLLICAYGCKEEDDRFGRVRDIFEYVYSVPVLGDADESGTIDASDARIVLRASVGLEEITASLKIRGDVDKDGELTSSDARTILRVAVGLEELKTAS